VSFIQFKNLLRCLLVSRTWNTLITQDNHLIGRISYQRKLKTRKRTYRQTSENSPPEVLHRLSSIRPILSDISMNAIQLFNHPDTAVSQQDSMTLPETKRCPCPNCHSPAKQLHLRRAECIRCKFDFCRHCFRSYHDGACKNKEELWGESGDGDGGGPSKIHIAGVKSKAVKKRLKRL